MNKCQTIKDQVSTFLSENSGQLKDHKLILVLLLFFAVVIWLFTSGPVNQSSPMNMQQSMMTMEQSMNTVNFGPGDAHHMHKAVDPSKYNRVNDISKAATDLPPPIQRSSAKTVEIKLVATEVISDIAPVTAFHYWTFDNTVPGPFLRVRVGDTVKLSLHNDKSSSHDHSIDLHAVTGPGGGAVLSEVEPGKTRTMQFKALNPGLYIYHCAAGNAPTHIANGMYGLILVEPEAGLAKVDKEFYIMQGELYTKGILGDRGFQDFDAMKMIAEQPDYIVFNGRPWSFVEKGQLQAEVGDQIRFFVGNGGVSKISSFHVIGEIFDRVYPEASTSPPLQNVQTTLIPAGGATITEFELNVPGDFVLVDHALARVDRGAWGILNVSGKKDDTLYSPVPAQ